LKYESKPLQGIFISRPNRFLGIVNLDNKKVHCFIPNPGRMKELLSPGAIVYLLKRPGTHRKTDFDLVLVEFNGEKVSIDSRLPNKLLMEAINKGKLPEFDGFFVKKTEPTIHDSRLDLLLTNDFMNIYLEAKSCTLVKENTALFPDAPTKRGTRHLMSLVKSLEFGRAVISFIIQRNDATSFKPNWETDLEFSRTLNYAVEKGVEAFAFTTKINLKCIYIQRRIPVVLN
jgi:sugar fermentation stimulation protein A